MQKAKTGTATWKRLSRRKRTSGELQAGSISFEKKGVIVAFEDETTHHNAETLYSQVHEF